MADCGIHRHTVVFKDVWLRLMPETGRAVEGNTITMAMWP